MTVEERLADEAVREWLGEAAMRVPIVAMNSSAWMVSSGEERYVLKISAPAEEAGLRVASWLNDHGLTTGAPLRMALRIRRRDLRGLIGDADNDKGLADARRVLVDS
jgi:hypothetical protein